MAPTAHPHRPGVFETLKARGFVKTHTDEDALAAHFDAGPVVYYAGFDPTADSLHAGHLLPVMCMSWLQRFGHKPIVVLGGGTGRVGDPTGKDRTRDMLTPERIAHNLQCQKEQISRYLSFEGDNAAIMVDNAEWLMEWGYVDFLREVGRHFSVNKMLTAEGVKQRLDRNQGLSFIEFNYHLLQSYDFLHLHREHGCTVQLGGDDQWFHFLGGIELINVAGELHHHGAALIGSDLRPQNLGGDVEFNSQPIGDRLMHRLAREMQGDAALHALRPTPNQRNGPFGTGRLWASVRNPP